MAISYIISGTRPNLSIQATDPYAIVVIIPHNTNDVIQNAYNAVREAFINAYDPIISFDCIWSGTGNIRTCQATDSNSNIITHDVDITQPLENIRREIIGKFVDLYGISDDNLFFQNITRFK